MLKFEPADADQMRTVQRAIVETLLPFKDRTEAALVVFALLRCARVMLRLYPKQTQAELLPLLTAYLEGKTSAPGAESDLLTLQ